MFQKKENILKLKFWKMATLYRHMTNDGKDLSAVLIFFLIFRLEDGDSKLRQLYQGLYLSGIGRPPLKGPRFNTSGKLSTLWNTCGKDFEVFQKVFGW